LLRHPAMRSARSGRSLAIVCVLIAGVVPGRTGAQNAGSVRPPVCVRHAHPVYPTGLREGRVEIELQLTVDEHGHALDPTILRRTPDGAGLAFDDAALEAVQGLVFEPATRDSVAVPARIRYRMVFLAPVNDVPRPAAPSPGSASIAAPRARTPPAIEQDPSGIVVRSRAPRALGAAVHDIEIRGLERVPRRSAGDLLGMAPGVLLSNEGTEGHAQHVYVRGFAGEGGRDLAMSVEGIPLNEESNVHSHGYADLYFVVPELVDRVVVTEGTADPRQGNFAVAGSVDFQLGLPTRGSTLRGSYGSFGYRRVAATWGPPETNERTFVGVESVSSDGYGPERRFERTGALAQTEFALGRGVVARLMGGLYASRWQSPGLLRDDDYRAGRVGFFDTYPTAGGQGGWSSRALAAATIEWRRGREQARMSLFGQLRDLGLLENFTGFVERPIVGDLTELGYGAITLGSAGHYRRGVQVLTRVHEVEVGWTFRHDRVRIDQHGHDLNSGQRSVESGPGDFAATGGVSQIGGYVDAAVRAIPRTTLHVGARVDGTVIDLRYAAPTADGRRWEPSPHSWSGLHFSPKTSVEVTLGGGLSAVASASTGFVSPSALALTSGDPVSFSEVVGEDIGLRWNAPTDGRTTRFRAAVAAFHTRVERDRVYEPAVGRDVDVGPTRRLGALAFLRVLPIQGVTLGASVAYTDAIVLMRTPDGAITAGSPLPYVPAWVARVDAGAERTLALHAIPAMHLHGGLGLSVHGARPLPLGGSTEPVALIDASIGAAVGRIDVSLAARNLLDSRWREAQFVLRSQFSPGAGSSQAPVLHFASGEPFSLRLTLTLAL